MKRRIIATLALVLLLASSAAAQEVSDAAWLKLLGEAKTTQLDQLNTLTVAENVLQQFKIAESADGKPLICGHPNDADPDIAFATPEELNRATGLPLEDCKSWIRMHRGLLQWQAATGRGSYPHSCVEGYAGIHAIYLFYDSATFKDHMKRPLTDAELQSIVDARVWGPNGGPDEPNFRSFTLPEVREAWGGVPMYEVIRDFRAETYRRVGVIILAVDLKGKFSNIHALSRYIPGGVIGIGWFPDGRSCPGDRVEYHIDNSYTSGFQGQVGLDVHECGHTLQGPHQFGRHLGNPASVHGDPMSYNFRDHLFVGYSTGHPLYGIPRSPSLDKEWIALYGGEPVGEPWQGKFGTTEPPPPTKPNGDFPYQVGDEIIQITLGRQMVLTVKSVEGDDGPTMAARIAEALAAVPDYPKKDYHRQALATVYLVGARAVAEEKMSFEKAAEAVVALREMLIGGDIDKWKGVLDIADDAKSGEAFSRIVEGLTGGEALSPEMIALIKTLIEMLPQGRLKLIATLILTLLEVLGAEEGEDGAEVKPSPVQKVGLNGHSIRPIWSDSYVLAPGA